MSSNLAMAVNPALLAWARAESGYGGDRAAKRLQVKEERRTVLEWLRVLLKVSAAWRQPEARGLISAT